jgi:hypothetical protein
MYDYSPATREAEVGRLGSEVGPGKIKRPLSKKQTSQVPVWLTPVILVTQEAERDQEDHSSKPTQANSL